MRFRRVLGALLSASLIVAACGSDSDEGGWGQLTTTTTTSEPPTTTTEPENLHSRLTGLEVDEAVRDRPVLAVKIDNAPKAVPQVGLNQADVVYEIQAEGHITRFMALFQSTDAENIGPVRSTRASDIAILEELNHPLFTWHGANAVMGAQVRASAIHPRSISDIAHLFYRDRSRPGPHNSFVQGTAQIRDTAPEGAKGPSRSLFTFGPADQPASPHAEPSSAVEVHYSGSGRMSMARYDWDQGSERWLRSQNGQPHLDAAGQQIAVDNVIVRFTEAVDEGRDSSGSVVWTAQMVGEGEAWVFSRGTVTRAWWRKVDNHTPTVFLDADGDPIKLKPGTTWVEIPFAKNGSHFG